METTLKAKNVSLNASMETYVEEKLAVQVRRILGGMDTPSALLAVEVGKSSRHHRKGAVWEAAATVECGKEMLRAEVFADGFQEAIDLLEGELMREVKKFKGRRSAVTLRGARRAKKNATIAKAARFYRKGRIREEGK